MVELELVIPSNTRGSKPGEALQLEQVRQQLEQLPAFDLAVRINELSKLLFTTRSAPVTLEIQGMVLELLEREVQGVISAFRKETRHHWYPLPQKPRALYTALQNMLMEAAYAYKSLLRDLLQQQNAAVTSYDLRPVMLRCIEYLTQQALQAYAIYEEAPTSIWQDLNRLYAYAEQRHLETEVVAHLSDLSISGAYARALLLSLVNPYRLMQGEIYRVYERLEKWALAVHLQPLNAFPPSSVNELICDRYYCDLAGDGPPAYGIKEVTGAPPVAPRLINLDELIDILNREMKTLAQNFGQSLQSRSEWELLIRLRSSWEKRLPRSGARHPRPGARVKAIVGLSGCHYFFSGYIPFEPEKSEVSLHGENLNIPRTLSLVPAGDTPWVDSDVQIKLETGIFNPRSYGFDTEHHEHDIWKKAHKIRQRESTEIEKRVEKRTLSSVFEFRLVNSSVGGEGLESMPGSPVKLRVGELVAAFPHNDAGEHDPVLHTIRWILSGPDRQLHIGLRRIDGEVTPVAVRALDGRARYTGYAKGFLIRGSTAQTSLILPSGQFNYGGILLLNDGEQLSLIRLNSVAESTRAFSHFMIKTLPMDEQSRDEIIVSLKRLLHEQNR